MATYDRGGTEASDGDPLHSAPWDQQPGEPNRWYARFEHFRLAGPNRSLLGTSNAEREQRGKRKGRSIPQAWARNASRWRWRERALAWDEHERRQARVAHTQEIEEMNRRHAQEAKVLQSKGLQGLKSVDPGQLRPTDSLRFLVEATKIERAARGEPETIAGSAENGNLPPLCMEEIVALYQQMETYEHERRHGTSTPAPGSPQEL
jgi:hypothetical protein